MIDWQPAIEQKRTITAKIGGELSPTRLDDWRREFRANRSIPPILVDEFGNVIDGNHRAQVASEWLTWLWGCVVRRVDGHWVSTGNVVKVLPAKKGA